MRLALRAAVAALAAANPAAADTLIDNIEGITVDREGKVERFSALLIDEAGKVAQRLQRGDKRPAKIDYRLDGKGRVLLPGMIDSHVRLIDLGLSTLLLDVSGAASLPEAQAQIARWSAENPQKPWVLGYGWRADSWGMGRFATAAEIDAAVARRPVWLSGADGHSGLANGAALAAAGITARTKDPAGGRIERLANGAPSGVLVGTATALVERMVPPPRPEDRDLALARAEDLLIRRGVTAVADMGTTIADWQSYRRAGDAGRLRLRIMAYAASIEDMALIGGPGPTPWLYDDRLRLNGVVLAADGALATGGALLDSPYAGAKTGFGLPRTGDAEIKNRMSRAALDRFQVAIEASGDRAVRQALDAFAELAQTYTGDRRWRIERLDLVGAADFARFGRQDVIASVQPFRALAEWAAAQRRLTAAQLASAHPWHSLDNGGAMLVFGSAAPGSTPDPFAGMAAAATRQDDGGEASGGWRPQEHVTRESALAAATARGAFAGFAEGRFGTLSVGERADFSAHRPRPAAGLGRGAARRPGAANVDRGQAGPCRSMMPG